MTKEKKVSKKRVTGEKKPRVTARQTIRKYCEIVRERGQKGDILTFGKHKYRMNKPFDELTNPECDQILVILKELGLGAHIKKAAVSVRKPVVTTDPKPCECGCKAMTRKGSRFLPGHDMKLRSVLLKKARAGNDKAKKELKVRKWA